MVDHCIRNDDRKRYKKQQKYHHTFRCDENNQSLLIQGLTSFLQKVTNILHYFKRVGKLLNTGIPVFRIVNT